MRSRTAGAMLAAVLALALGRTPPRDRAGVIRYTHVGEGADARTEQVIQQLLAEP